VPIAAERHLVVEQAETGFYMSIREWRRLRRHAEDIREPIHWVRNLGWACFTLAPTAILAWFPWSAAYSQLPEAAKLEYAWVGPAMILLALFCGVGSIVCYFMNSSHQKEIGRDKANVLDAMDAIEERLGFPPSPHDPA
jgi:hypothetical protein